MDVGASGALLETLRTLLADGLPLETVLPAFTSNPARLLRLADKGRVETGADADLLVLDATGAAHTSSFAGKSTSAAAWPCGGARSRTVRSSTLPSIVPEGGTRGWIIPIGGAENKENDRHILERFVRVSGGRDADIVVIPTASRLAETGPRYEKLFRELGAERVTVDGLRHASRLPRTGPPRAARAGHAASSSPAATSCACRRCSAARRSPS